MAKAVNYCACKVAGALPLRRLRGNESAFELVYFSRVLCFATVPPGSQLTCCSVVALGEIRLRRRLESEGVKPTLKMWLFPWLSWLLVGGIVVVLILMALTPDLRKESLWSTASAAIVAIAYLARRRASPA